MMPGLGLHEKAKFNCLESALQFLQFFFRYRFNRNRDALVYFLTISYQDSGLGDMAGLVWSGSLSVTA